MNLEKKRNGKKMLLRANECYPVVSQEFWIKKEHFMSYFIASGALCMNTLISNI